MKKLTGLAMVSALALLLPWAAPMAEEEEQAAMPTPEEMCPQMDTCSMHQMMQCMQGGGMMGMGKGRGKGCMHGPMGCMLHQSGGPGFLEMNAEELRLSDEQLNQIKGIWSEHKKAAIRKKADVEIAEMELQEILRQHPVDFDKAKSKIERVGSLRQEMQLGMLEAMRKSHDVLTDEQSDKLMTLQKAGCCGMMKHGGMMEHGGMMMHGKKMHAMKKMKD
jgi:Spy/CpxP family protein refolding chaperone